MKDSVEVEVGGVGPLDKEEAAEEDAVVVVCFDVDGVGPSPPSLRVLACLLLISTPLPIFFIPSETDILPSVDNIPLLPATGFNPPTTPVCIVDSPRVPAVQISERIRPVRWSKRLERKVLADDLVG